MPWYVLSREVSYRENIVHGIITGSIMLYCLVLQALEECTFGFAFFHPVDNLIDISKYNFPDRQPFVTQN